MKRILVQFDGGNFYKKVKALSPDIHLTNFNYTGFVKSLIDIKPNNVVYYVGEIRKYVNNRKSQILYSNQQSLFSRLRQQKIDIKLGYFLFTDGKYHEKGVDVQIAVDIVRGAIKDEYDECYLISSDIDLLPAIRDARSEDKKIVYVAFENFISHALKNNCSDTLIIKKSDIVKFRKENKNVNRN